MIAALMAAGLMASTQLPGGPEPQNPYLGLTFPIDVRADA